MLLVFVSVQRSYLHVPLPPTNEIQQSDVDIESLSTKTLSFTDETSTNQRDFKRVYEFNTISAGCAGHGQHCLVKHQAESKGIVATFFTTRPGTTRPR